MFKRLSEWYKSFFPCDCEYDLRRNWAMMDGNLVCLRVFTCMKCGDKDERLLLIATKENIEDAQSKVIHTGDKE